MKLNEDSDDTKNMKTEMNEAAYYVYLHRDPETEEVVYVGKGCGGRAWETARRSNRNDGHKDRIKHWISLGYLPCDWVEILSRTLLQTEAFELEKKYIHTHAPIHNDANCGQNHYKTKLTNERVRDIFLAHKGGMRVKDIIEDTDLSRDVVDAIVNRRQWKMVTACLV